MRTVLALLLAGCAAEAGSLDVGPRAGSTWSGRAYSGSPTVFDLFDDGVVVGTEWDVPNDCTVAEGSRGMTITCTGAAGTSGVYRAAPVGDAVVTARLMASVAIDATVSLDLGIADDLAGAPTTANLYSVRMDLPTDDAIAVDQADYSAQGTPDATETDGGLPSLDPGGVYLQLCIDSGDDVTACISSTAQSWYCTAEVAWATTGISGVADYVYLGVGGAGAATMIADLYRVDAGLTACRAGIGGYE